MKRKIIGFGIISLWVLGRAVKSYGDGDADLQESLMTAGKNAGITYSDEASWYEDGKHFAV